MPSAAWIDHEAYLGQAGPEGELGGPRHRLEGTPPARLRRMLLLEGALILGAGACTGVVGGIYGQAAIDGYLRSVTGFPVLRTGVAALPLEVLATVLLTVILSAALPAWLASRVPATLAFDER